MADFELAIPVTLAHEGVHSNSPGDPGGDTWYGWSKPMVDRLGITAPKSPEEAVALYRRYFWPVIYDLIQSQNVATKLFDDGVNQGQGTAVKTLQRALMTAGHPVTIDGSFGTGTLSAVNNTAESVLLPLMRLYQWETYDAWIKQDPLREADRLGLARRAAWPDVADTIAICLIDHIYQPQGVENAKIPPAQSPGVPRSSV